MESKFPLPRPLRAQPWLPLNHAAKGHVTAPTLIVCISNQLFPLSFFSSLLTFAFQSLKHSKKGHQATKCYLNMTRFCNLILSRVKVF